MNTVYYMFLPKFAYSSVTSHNSNVENRIRHNIMSHVKTV